jgi:hypothetical protein
MSGIGNWLLGFGVLSIVRTASVAGRRTHHAPVRVRRDIPLRTRYIALYRSVKTVGAASTVLRLEILPRTKSTKTNRAYRVGLKTGSADGSHRVATRNTAPGGFRLNLGRSPIRPDGAIAPRSVSTFRVRLLGNF